jgi:hypothetical protein
LKIFYFKKIITEVTCCKVVHFYVVAIINFRASPPTKIRGSTTGNDVINRGGTPNSSIDLEWEIDGNLLHHKINTINYLYLNRVFFHLWKKINMKLQPNKVVTM